MRALALLLPCTVGCAANLAGGERAPKFGVYEVALTGDGGVANPFDTLAQVTFTPPEGEPITVEAFYDGGDTWRARVYADRIGAWRWTSQSADDGLSGRRGEFAVGASPLPGRLLPHPRNPRHWITEDGRWFVNLNDTAYFLLGANDQLGRPVSDEQAMQYVRDAMERGITSFRSLALVGPKGEPQGGSAWTEAVFTDAAGTRPRLELLQQSDRRLRRLLDEHPDACLQLIVLPLGTRWGTDDAFWHALEPAARERLLRHVVARYAAYPQLFWLVVNDAHYGDKFPHNNALAREVGGYLAAHDPWRHPVSTGHARFLEFQFAAEPWCTYLHLENAFAFEAAACALHYDQAKPVFLGEDRYEHDHPDRDPRDMPYFQRRLFWSWLLSGGSANYGSRWWAVTPYAHGGELPCDVHLPGRGPARFDSGLAGLRSVAVIRDYFAPRGIELPEFEPDPALAADADGRTGPDAPKAMRRAGLEAVIYHPHPRGRDRDAVPEPDQPARLRLDLRAMPGRLQVEWLRADDGQVAAGDAIAGGEQRELTAPWPADVVLWLRAE